jgi:hypothetical protein
MADVRLLDSTALTSTPATASATTAPAGQTPALPAGAPSLAPPTPSDPDGLISRREARARSLADEQRSSDDAQGLKPPAVRPLWAAAAPKSTLAAVIRQYFASWDRNHNGFVSKEDIDLAMQDPSLHGDAAAALLALKVKLAQIEALHNDGLFANGKGVSLADLTAMQEKLEASDGGAKELEAWFEYGQEHSRAITRTLFTHRLPDPLAIQQGFIGDCYFLAAVADVAKGHPDVIKNMITDNHDGTFTVRFPDGRSADVQAPTDAECIMYSTSGRDGLWLTVVEKAYGAVCNHSGFHAIFPCAEPFDAADGGGHLSEGITAMTGHATDTDSLGIAREETTRRKLSAAAAEGRIASLATTSYGSGNIQGLPRQHAYTVLGYDARTDTVTIRNPWGCQELVDAQGKPLDGVDDGVFRVPLKDLNKYFAQICYEKK